MMMTKPADMKTVLWIFLFTLLVISPARAEDRTGQESAAAAQADAAISLEPAANPPEMLEQKRLGSPEVEGYKGSLGQPRSFFPSPEKTDLPETQPAPAQTWPQVFSKAGISVEMTVDPAAAQPAAKGDTRELMEGQDVDIRLKITDSATGDILSGINPAVWIDPHVAQAGSGKDTAPTSCTEKIKWFLQGSLALHPAIDLNTYYILTLNDTSSISVLDPHLGFYISKLVTIIPLISQGEDWVLTRDGQSLYVTMPAVNQVAVINTDTWKVVANIEAGPSPARIAFQPDETYLWIGNDSADGGITILDREKQTLATRIPTGAGHHEIAFTDDNRYAFVSNETDGTITVIDIPKLEKIDTLRTGERPVSIAYSSFAKALYVADATTGTISVVDGSRPRIVGTIEAKPGLRAIRFSPDGRWGFAVNYNENSLDIVDSSINRILYNVALESKPDQVSFTDGYAYIRAAGSDQVNSIQLSLLGKEERIPALKFPSGRPALESSAGALADVIVPTPEGGVVLVANPVDKTVYYYMEGMLAPMGSFQNYGRVPRAVAVVDRSLRETSPGVYASTFKLPGSGTYDVAFIMDNPLVYNCFEMTVQENPALARKRALPLHLELFSGIPELMAGETNRLLVKVTDPRTNLPQGQLKDLGALYFQTAGNWQKRVRANPIGEGVYEVEIDAPRPGLYQVFFDCPSLSLQSDQLPTLTLRAVSSKTAIKDS